MAGEPVAVSSDVADSVGATLREDEDSFAAPRRQARADCIAAFKAASRKVKGAEARVAAATKDLRTLNQFMNEIGDLLETRGFRDLPELRRGREVVEAVHQLTIGPWRGIFLVRPDGSEVIGLVFSRAPHALESRLDEITAAYRAHGKEEAGNDEQAD